MVLWLLLLGFWMLLLSLTSTRLDANLRVWTLAVMGWVNAGFALFTLISSSPFTRNLPLTPEDGADLNPLLQDLGMALHPPVLYSGYVGFVVVFALACAGLISGKLDARWVAAIRPWVTAAWVLLTCGIALGSWWAYYELGWGGWWFWDPVENVSLMPWLAGTALLHSLMIAARGGFMRWVILLSILAFALSMLGTFLVRSGLLTSVHAFASDPERGIFMLSLTMFYTLVALLLYAWRSRGLSSQPIDPTSTDGLLFFNNLLFMGVLGMVLVGTLFPMTAELSGAGLYSVGAPYFNTLGSALGALMLLGSGLVALASRRVRQSIFKSLGWPLLGAVLMVLAVVSGYGMHPLGLAVAALAGWNLGAVGLITHRRAWGMRVAHIGLSVFALGVGVSSAYSIEREVLMQPGSTLPLAHYQLNLASLDGYAQDNYIATRANFYLDPPSGESVLLQPEKRRYSVRDQVMTEVAINPGVLADVYVALGDVRDNGAWVVRAHYKPLIRWVWGGALLMALGALIATFERRAGRVL